MSQICSGPHNKHSKQRRLNSFGEQSLEGKDMIYLIVISLSDFNTIRDIITDTHSILRYEKISSRKNTVLCKMITLEVAFLEKGNCCIFSPPHQWAVTPLDAWEVTLTSWLINIHNRFWLGGGRGVHIGNLSKATQPIFHLRDKQITPSSLSQTRHRYGIYMPFLRQRYTIQSKCTHFKCAKMSQFQACKGVYISNV